MKSELANGKGQYRIEQSARLRIGILLTLLLSFFLNNVSFTQTLLGNPILGGQENSYFGICSATSESGDRVIVGAPLEESNLGIPGAAHAYEWNGLEWQQLGQTLYGDELRGNFGYKVSMSADGNTIAVGDWDGRQNGIASGTIKIFTWNSNEWQLKGSPIYGESFQSRQYQALLNGDGTRIVIMKNSGVGHIKVLEYSGTDWNIVSEHFGSQQISINGSMTWSENEILAVCGNCSDHVTGPGEVNVYHTSGPTFSQIGQTIPSNITSTDHFGRYMDISEDGEWLAISSLTGSFVYKFEAGSYNLKSEIPGVWGTISLNDDGSRMVIGSNDSDNQDQGSVSFFERNVDSYEFITTIQFATVQGGFTDASVALNGTGNRTFASHPFGEVGTQSLGVVKAYEWPLTSSIQQESFAVNFEVYPNPLKGNSNLYIRGPLSIRYITACTSNGQNIPLDFDSNNAVSIVNFLSESSAELIHLTIQWDDGSISTSTITKL